MPYLTGVSSSAHGIVTSPAAAAPLATIANLSVLNQIYQIDAYISISGTVVAAVDNDNISLIGASTSAGSPNPIVLPVIAGGAESHVMLRVQAATAGGQFALQATALATTGAVYAATLIVTPLLEADEL